MSNTHLPSRSNQANMKYINACQRMRNRYRLERRGFRWCVLCGTGERPLFKSFSGHTAERVRQQLQTAFYDGLYIASEHYE